MEYLIFEFERFGSVEPVIMVCIYTVFLYSFFFNPDHCDIRSREYVQYFRNLGWSCLEYYFSVVSVLASESERE